MTVEGTEPVVAAPAPWDLKGVGYILFFKFGRRFLDNHPQPLPRGLGKPKLGIGTVMIVDYQHSAVGPYHELLIMPGVFAYGGGRYHPSITKIFVSTQASIVNGRANWGIPKEYAHFQVERDNNEERIKVHHQNRVLADVRLSTFGFEIPVTTGLLPGYFRTIIQPYEGHFYKTVLGGKGRIKPARLLDASINDQHFPDFNRGRLLAAFKVTRFDLRFPTPTIQPWSA